MRDHSLFSMELEVSPRLPSDAILWFYRRTQHVSLRGYLRPPWARAAPAPGFLAIRAFQVVMPHRNCVYSPSISSTLQGRLPAALANLGALAVPISRQTSAVPFLP